MLYLLERLMSHNQLESYPVGELPYICVGAAAVLLYVRIDRLSVEAFGLIEPPQPAQRLERQYLPLGERIHLAGICAYIEQLLGLCVDTTEITRAKTLEAEAKAKQEELEARLSMQDQLLEQNSMITAISSDYRSVYHVNLDNDDAVCYRADPNDHEQHKEGEHFPFHERFAYYANTFVTEKYRQGFLDFIDPDSIREALSRENIITYRYLVNRYGREYYKMFRMAGVRHTTDRDDNIVHAIGAGFTVIDQEMRETLDMNRALSEALISGGFEPQQQVRQHRTRHGDHKEYRRPDERQHHSRI